MTENAFLTSFWGCFTDHQTFCDLYFMQNPHFHKKTEKNKTNANWYTDSLTGILQFTLVSTLRNPEVFALPSHFTDRSLTPAVHLPYAAKATAPGPVF